MKSMVCIISGQHVPNLLTIHEIKPDRLFFLETSEMRKNRDYILNALEKGGLDYRNNYESVEISDANSIDEIYQSLSKIYDSSPDDEWYLNLTGGTKPMGMGGYAFAKDKGLKTLYVAEVNQRQAIDLLGGVSVELNYNVSIEEFLAGYGFLVDNNKEKLIQSKKEAEKLSHLAALITSNSDNDELSKLLGKLQYIKNRDENKKWDRKGIELSEEDNLRISNTKLGEEISATFGLNYSDNKLKGKLTSSGVKFLTGIWLEVFIYNILLPFNNKKIYDLNTGIRFRKINPDERKKPGEDNEIDTCFMYHQSLFIVECKTGGQRHDDNAQGTLYKIEAIKSGLGAIRINTYLATTSPNIIDNKTKEIKPSVKNRCDIYGCKILQGDILKSWADRYLSGDEKLNNDVAKFFRLH